MPQAVRAAGGVLHRPGADGVEICVVHRPRYQDWSLPKGKLAAGEHPLAGAMREVHEETGWHARPQLRLRLVEYVLPDGTPKTVEFWLMAANSGGPVPDTDEVDQLAWLPVDAAFDRLTYPDDRALIEQVAALPPVTAVAVLVRHAHAGERKRWSGNDALRPIDPLGQAQAERIGALSALFGPERLVSATPLRCKQTLEPLAAALAMPIVLDGAFAEPAAAAEAPAKAKVAAQRLLDLRAGGLAVVCSQGKIMPHLLAGLRDEDDPAPYKTPKGGGWVLTWSADRLLGLSRL
jgi:8-oxo-dGTP pyrophosphatase MutT (NUDIX family)/phosphohistidine phosphatase SixA